MQEDLLSLQDLIDTGGTDAQIRPLVRDLLERIADGRQDFPTLRHPLGFLYSQLVRQPDQVLRLHIWKADRPPAPLTTSPYHTHAWRLKSYVFAGPMTNLILRPQAADGPAEPADGEPVYRVFDIYGEGQIDVIRPTGQLVRAHVESTQALRSGELYQIPADTYHGTIVDDGGWAATIALVRRDNTASERTLGPPDIGTHRTVRETSPAGELAAASAALLSAYEKTSAGV